MIHTFLTKNRNWIVFLFSLLTVHFYLNCKNQKDYPMDIKVDFLSDETPASCGCFAWLSPKPFSNGKLIYQEIETDSKNYRNIIIDGKILDLTKISKTKFNKYLHANPGLIIEESLTSKNIKIDAKWTVQKVISPNEESARSTEFRVEFLIQNSIQEKKILGSGYCGC